MNRKKFLRNLVIGAGAVVIAPRTLAEIKEDSIITSNGLIIPKDQGIEAGDVITTDKEWGIVEEHNGYLIATMIPIMEDIQRSWLKIQVAIQKTKQ